MTTEFDSNTFEHDYIIRVLSHFVSDLRTHKPAEQIIDRYAVALTSFMNGQIVQAVKATKQGSEEFPLQEQGEDFRKGVRAVFDYLHMWAANNYHGNPKMNKLCDVENELVLRLAEDALEEISEADCVEWVEIKQLLEENRELRAQLGRALGLS